MIFGTVSGVEKFTLRKLFGVLASFAGIILISTVDISGESDRNRGSFPHKSKTELAIGDALALLSAILYGMYAVLMKKRIENEARVDMPIFFGLVGLFNTVFLWPIMIALSVTGVEKFELPPTGRILMIVLVRNVSRLSVSFFDSLQINSATSLVSDFCWAYATLLTSPLVVTVGLSLTIPLSLVGQMIIDSQYAGITYWIGAFIVLLSFIVLNNESRD